MTGPGHYDSNHQSNQTLNQTMKYTYNSVFKSRVPKSSSFTSHEPRRDFSRNKSELEKEIEE